MEPREAMAPSCAVAVSQDSEWSTRKCRVQELHRTADARRARHPKDNTRGTLRKDGLGIGLAVLLVSLSLWPWPCSAFISPWSTARSSFLAHPLQLRSPAKSCNRWPAARVSNRGGLLSGATSGMIHERVLVYLLVCTCGIFVYLMVWPVCLLSLYNGHLFECRLQHVHVHFLHCCRDDAAFSSSGQQPGAYWYILRCTSASVHVSICLLLPATLTEHVACRLQQHEHNDNDGSSQHGVAHEYVAPAESSCLPV